MNKYDKKWKEAAIPRPPDLTGQFQVTILSGYFEAIEPFMNDWQKTIYRGEGHNTANGKTMGQFTLSFTKDIMYFEYSAYPDQKPKYWTRLRDEIRITAPGHFIGRIWFEFFGKPRFMGYFALTQISELTQDEAYKIATWERDFPALIEYIKNLWVFDKTSSITQFGQFVEISTGVSKKNALITTALKANFIFWRFNYLAVDEVGFYQFKLPEVQYVETHSHSYPDCANS